MNKSYIIAKPWGGACGIGHQFNNWLVAWLLANKYGLNFVHSPFCGDRTQSQIDVPVKLWEKFLNFGDSQITEKQLPKNLKKIQLPKLTEGKRRVHSNITCNRPEWKNLIEQYKDSGVLFECQRDQFVTLNWNYLNADQLQDRYWRARRSMNPIRIDFQPHLINVAIHIRRGDIEPSGRFKERWVPTKIYSNIMDQIRKVFCEQYKICFHIFTDAQSEEELSELKNNDTVFSLWKTDIFSVFHHMVTADILVTGQSAFSSLAAILSNNIKVVRPWGPLWDNFPKNEKFIEVDKNGFFDTNKLRKEIA